MQEYEALAKEAVARAEALRRAGKKVTYSSFSKDGRYIYRLSSRTCLSGDVIGDYAFDHELKIGDELHFEDMALYTIVKNNTFNGMPLPSIVLEHENNELEILREFSYDNFKARL